MRRIIASVVTCLALLAPVAVVTEAPASAHQTILHCSKQTLSGSNWAGMSYGNNSYHQGCGFQLQLRCQRLDGSTYWKYKTRYLSGYGGGLTFLYCTNSWDVQTAAGTLYWYY